jgi:hypothetical protein
MYSILHRREAIVNFLLSANRKREGFYYDGPKAI